MDYTSGSQSLITPRFRYIIDERISTGRSSRIISRGVQPAPPRGRRRPLSFVPRRTVPATIDAEILLIVAKRPCSGCRPVFSRPTWSKLSRGSHHFPRVSTSRRLCAFRVTFTHAQAHGGGKQGSTAITTLRQLLLMRQKHHNLGTCAMKQRRRLTQCSVDLNALLTMPTTGAHNAIHVKILCLSGDSKTRFIWFSILLYFFLLGGDGEGLISQ